MFLYWLNFWFVYFDQSWNKVFKCCYLKCFTLACKRSTNQKWHFFQVTFQSYLCFSPFWTDPWKQKAKNILHFHCANWNNPKPEPLASCERVIRDFSQGSCLQESIFFSPYSMCDHQGSGRQMSTIHNPTTPGWRLLVHLHQCATVASGVNFRSNPPLFVQELLG